jgi:hypothetical protein
MENNISIQVNWASKSRHRNRVPKVRGSVLVNSQLLIAPVTSPEAQRSLAGNSYLIDEWYRIGEVRKVCPLNGEKKWAFIAGLANWKAESYQYYFNEYESIDPCKALGKMPLSVLTKFTHVTFEELLNERGYYYFQFQAASKYFNWYISFVKGLICSALEECDMELSAWEQMNHKLLYEESLHLTCISVIVKYKDSTKQ